MKKYFTSRSEANKAKEQRDPEGYKGIKVYLMKRGANKGKFAVCTWMEYLNIH